MRGHVVRGAVPIGEFGQAAKNENRGHQNAAGERRPRNRIGRGHDGTAGKAVENGRGGRVGHCLAPQIEDDGTCSHENNTLASVMPLIESFRPLMSYNDGDIRERGVWSWTL